MTPCPPPPPPRLNRGHRAGHRARRGGRADARALAGDEGSVTPFVILTALALMLAVGLVVDGGQKLRAIQRADAAAEEAARAAGQVIQVPRSVRGLTPLVDPAPATAAAQAHLEVAGVAGTVAVDGPVVTVTTTTTEPTVFLAAIGIPTVTATGTAQARLVRGLTQEVP